jgi:hypothetical protein
VLVAGALVIGACTSDDDEPSEAATTASPPPTAIPSGTRDELLTLIQRLEVADPDPSRPRYVRDDWDEGRDEDGDCLRTRHEVLADESLVPATIEDCHVLAGEWVDPLTGQDVTDPDQLQVDHLVALADAHRSGGWRWDTETKGDYANSLTDPDLLNAVLGAENERKADAGPEAYRPPNRESWCWYGFAYARVKATWSLTVTPEQADGLRQLAQECPAA